MIRRTLAALLLAGCAFGDPTSADPTPADPRAACDQTLDDCFSTCPENAAPAFNAGAACQAACRGDWGACVREGESQ